MLSLNYTFVNVSLALHEGHLDQELLDIQRFGKLKINNLTLQNSGNTVVFNYVTCVPRTSNHTSPPDIRRERMSDVANIVDSERNRVRITEMAQFITGFSNLK
jgi:hypothetical protein